MTDKVDPATRSHIMAAIRGKDTGPEMKIRSLLHRAGFRFRLHARELPGRPDIVFPRHHAVIFVHGCFWHGHDCPAFRRAGTNKEFWDAKIQGNRDRDERTRTALIKLGWRVAVVWECGISGPSRLKDEILARRIGAWLLSNRRSLDIRGRAQR